MVPLFPVGDGRFHDHEHRKHAYFQEIKLHCSSGKRELVWLEMTERGREVINWGEIKKEKFVCVKPEEAPAPLDRMFGEQQEVP